MSDAIFNLLDPLRDAAVRGDVIVAHKILNYITEEIGNLDRDLTRLEQRIINPSIGMSFDILNEHQSTPRPLLDAAKTVVGVVLFGLACRAWMGMSW